MERPGLVLLHSPIFPTSERVKLRVDVVLQPNIVLEHGCKVEGKHADVLERAERVGPLCGLTLICFLFWERDSYIEDSGWPRDGQLTVVQIYG